MIESDFILNMQKYDKDEITFLYKTFQEMLDEYLLNELKEKFPKLSIITIELTPLYDSIYIVVKHDRERDFSYEELPLVRELLTEIDKQLKETRKTVLEPRTVIKSMTVTFDENPEQLVLLASTLRNMLDNYLLEQLNESYHDKFEQNFSIKVSTVKYGIEINVEFSKPYLEIDPLRLKELFSELYRIVYSTKLALKTKGNEND